VALKPAAVHVQLVCFKPLPMSIKADDPEHGDGWSLQDQETRETAEGNTPFPHLAVCVCMLLIMRHERVLRIFWEWQAVEKEAANTP